jgi:alpha-galactosidase
MGFPSSAGSGLLQRSLPRVQRFARRFRQAFTRGDSFLALSTVAVLLLAALSLSGQAGYIDVHLQASPEPLVRYTSGKTVYVEGLVDGRWVGRYWSAGGRINVPYELYADDAFQLEVGDQQLSSGWQWVDGHEVAPSSPGARHFVVELISAKRPVRLKIHTLLDGTPVLVRWLEVTNTSEKPLALSAVSPWSGRLFRVRADRLALPSGTSEVFKVGYFAKITHGWEGWLHWRPLQNETFEVQCHVGHGFNDPFFVLRNEAAGEYFIGHLAWSANWNIGFRTEQDPAGKEADLWFNAGPWASIAQRVIAPNESVSTPSMHLGYVEGDLDQAVQAMHDHIRRSVMPPRDPKRAYLIQYAVPGDQGYIAKKAGDLAGMNEQNIMQQVDMAAALGAELFIVDAGWWDVYGDWTPSPERFPNGLAPIVDYIHKKGMLFGLYNEVTGGRGDWTHGEIYKRHPDWFLPPYALIDLTKPAAADFVERQSEEMIDRYKVDLFRLDYNPGFDGEMGQSTRDGIDENLYWRYYENTYRIFERLKAKYPHVIFQQAAAGGGRNDLGFSSRFDEEYTTDGLDMPPVLQDYSGQTLGLPPEILVNAFGIPEHSSNRGHLDTHLRISFTLGTPWLAPVAPSLHDLNPEIQEQYLHYATLYKSFIRPLLPTCRVYHHAPVNDRDGVDTNPWFAMEFSSPDRQRAWATIVHLKQSDSDVYHFRPRGLDPGKMYDVTLDSKSATMTVAGFRLIQEGLPIRLASVESSELILFKAK